MSTYTYTTLTDDVRKNISSGQYGERELRELYNELQKKVDAGRKKMKKILIIVAIVYVIAFLPAVKSVFDMEGSTILDAVAMMLLPLPFFALGYALARWHTYGMFSSQFNRAVKKGYPLLAEELKL